MEVNTFVIFASINIKKVPIFTIFLSLLQTFMKAQKANQVTYIEN